MRTIKLEIELTYDNEGMHDDDKEGIGWFHNDILLGEKGALLLHSNEIGDAVGEVKCIKILPS